MKDSWISKIGTFILSQLIVGLVLLILGGLIAPIFWKTPAPENKTFMFCLYAAWFIGSWAFIFVTIVSTIYPDFFMPMIDYIDGIVETITTYKPSWAR